MELMTLHSFLARQEEPCYHNVSAMTLASQLRVSNNHCCGALGGSSVTNALNSGKSSAKLATR